MNSEETRNLRELVVKNWKINKFSYLMVDERGEYPFFKKLIWNRQQEGVPFETSRNNWIKPCMHSMRRKSRF